MLQGMEGDLGERVAEGDENVAELVGVDLACVFLVEHAERRQDGLLLRASTHTHTSRTSSGHIHVHIHTEHASAHANANTCMHRREYILTNSPIPVDAAVILQYLLPQQYTCCRNRYCCIPVAVAVAVPLLQQQVYYSSAPKKPGNRAATPKP